MRPPWTAIAVAIFAAVMLALVVQLIGAATDAAEVLGRRYEQQQP